MRNSIEKYASDKALLGRYLKANGITHIQISNDYTRGYGRTWTVWEMCDDYGGFPYSGTFDRKHKAVSHAKELASITGLPYVKTVIK